jgi:hypothetical protein
MLAWDQVHRLEGVDLASGGPYAGRAPPRRPDTAAIRGVGHVGDPDTADGETILGGDTYAGPLVRELEIRGGVVNLHNGTAGGVDVGELSFIGGLAGDIAVVILQGGNTHEEVKIEMEEEEGRKVSDMIRSIGGEMTYTAFPFVKLSYLS